MLYERRIVNATNRRVRVLFSEAWTPHVGLPGWIPQGL